MENPVKKVFREGKVVGLADHMLLISKNGISPSRWTHSVLAVPTDISGGEVRDNGPGIPPED